jgi:hypothetical protein
VLYKISIAYIAYRAAVLAKNFTSSYLWVLLLSAWLWLRTLPAKKDTPGHPWLKTPSTRPRVLAAAGGVHTASVFCHVWSISRVLLYAIS